MWMFKSMFTFSSSSFLASFRWAYKLNCYDRRKCRLRPMLNQQTTCKSWISVYQCNSISSNVPTTKIFRPVKKDSQFWEIYVILTFRRLLFPCFQCSSCRMNGKYSLFTPVPNHCNTFSQLNDCGKVKEGPT